MGFGVGGLGSMVQGFGFRRYPALVGLLLFKLAQGDLRDTDPTIKS